MKNKINSTDLRVQFKMDTGEYHAWGAESDGFHKDTQYKREYSDWLEERHVKLLNEQIAYQNQLDSFEDAIVNLEDDNEALRDEVDYLEDLVENN